MMFIKLTRLDGQPIWINASFLVTVEPRRQGGATVVPIGDGLDYDVKESPERVLALAAGAPEPVVVPVPTSDALTPTPEDVSPEPERSAGEDARTAETATPAKKAMRPRTRKTRKPSSAAPDPAAPESVATDPAAPESVASAAPVEKPVPPEVSISVRYAFTDDQVARLKKMAPRSVKRLLNALATQFKVADPEAVVKTLVERGILKLEQDHVNWN